MKLEEIGHPALVWISCFRLDLLSWRYEETGDWIENKRLPHWITWLLLCLPLPYFFNNKRHRHCFFILSSAEKRGSTVLKQPHYGTVYLHFSEQYLPICNSFPPLQPLLLAFLSFPRPCVLRPAWSVRVPPILR